MRTNSNKLLHCVQAKQLCTASRAKKVVIGFAAVSLTVNAIDSICLYLYDTFVTRRIVSILFYVVLPVAVLVINMVVLREVR